MELSNLINNDKITQKLESESFVAIKIDSEKEEYVQFCKICKYSMKLMKRHVFIKQIKNSIDQLVPVPSIFFIKNGIPIKVITSALKSVEAIEEAISSVLANDSIPATSSAQFIAGEIASGSSSLSTAAAAAAKEETPTEIVCEGDVCYKKESTESSETAVVKEKEETEEEKQEKIRHAMKLIGEKRAERVKEEEKLELEREVQRRKEGKTLIKLKEWQNEQELKQLKDDRLRDKNEAKAARQRVLDQIEQDKKERAQRYQQFASPTTADQPPSTEKPATPTTPTIPPNSTRIQFKKPDGESEIVTFDADMLFADIHAFVMNDVLNGTNIKEFTLATTFPRREFTSEDFNKTLIDLNLVPSSVIIIIPAKKAKRTTSNHFDASNLIPTQTDGSFFDMISALIMGLFSPVFNLFSYVGRLVTGNRNVANENNDSEAGKRKRNEDVLTPNDAAKKRNLNSYFVQQPEEYQAGTSQQSGAYKRTSPSSNIHRLHQDTDSEDEDRKTWNGNSTQQM